MKIFACAALLLASCGGMQTAGEQAQTPETKTAVKHGPEIGHDCLRIVSEPSVLA